MNRQFSILFILFVAIGLISCSDDEKLMEIDEEWKEYNENFFAQIAMSGEYNEIKSGGNEGSIYYKVLQEGEGTERIYWGSKVKVYYEGFFVDEDNRRFDWQTREEGSPAEFTAMNSGVIKGWVTALQYMVIGDKWEVYIPQQLAYGRTGNSTPSSKSGYTIPPYSTLRFIIEVMEITEQ